ncbi:hypothetical protein OG760_16090 [Streptomyces sp. NBC_00963]|uniref:hypothetical protein n=1 Tax=Streptomyces sp. NBC_00963 TaxID=2903697 RepID=UPI00386EFE97|nr:hypothetical protein OG760_16090 [Streptomyces sp. NBC_00963]
MTEVSRSAARRTEVEVSCIPEVAALATELTTLFNALDIPQQQYAARISMDKSTVSRFLNGRRVATQDFIDRLLAELERHRRTTITGETRDQLRSMRLSALKMTDPASFQLEFLRDELDRSHRVIKRLNRQQQALELLLDEREAKADEARREMQQLRSDWVSERRNSEAVKAGLSKRNEHLGGEQERLREEIEELKQQLSELMQLKYGAEEKCVRLEERLFEVERELASHLEEIGDQAFLFTPEEVAHEILQSYGEQRFHDAARTLSLAAAHFSSADVVQLWRLIVEMRRYLDAETLIRDAIRFKSAELSADIVEGLLGQNAWPMGQSPNRMLGTSLAFSKSSTELGYLYDRWKGGGPPFGVLRFTFTLWCEVADIKLIFARLCQLKDDNDTVIMVRMLHALGKRSAADVVNLTDLLIDREMNAECETLFRGWYAGISVENRSAFMSEWAREAHRAKNSGLIGILPIRFVRPQFR